VRPAGKGDECQERLEAVVEMHEVAVQFEVITCVCVIV
jgi:hypothetical protein